MRTSRTSKASPHDDDEDEGQYDKVEDNNKDDDNNNKNDNNDKVISALELDRDMVFARTSRKSRTSAS